MEGQKVATFAGGCFWCMVQPFEKAPGVVQVISGYAGGTQADPTYHDYAQKGYVEVVQITYDPAKISYEHLLDIFWKQIDPTDAGGQFHDRGPHYATVIFYHDDEQKKLAEASKQQLEDSKRFAQPIATEILKFTTFYPAEQYHQQYYKTNPESYKSYRHASGRDAFIAQHWKK